MKRIIVLLSLSLLAMPVLAATAQQEKMKTCNADAARQSLKGDARKAFMKECLSAKAEAKEEQKAKTPQQEKMKQCNADAAAKQLKGEDRKKFMSDCLKTKK
jgi:predicted lysophospholipase L1 biosynthesis ABC-type transport system permease subunit